MFYVGKTSVSDRHQIRVRVRVRVNSRVRVVVFRLRVSCFSLCIDWIAAE